MAYAFSFNEVFNGNSEFNKKFLDGTQWNEKLKERNEKMIKILQGVDVPTFENVDDMNAYNEMREGFKVVTE